MLVMMLHAKCTRDYLLVDKMQNVRTFNDLKRQLTYRGHLQGIARINRLSEWR